MTVNSEQGNAAKEALAGWLEHVPSVRQRPARSRIAGEFDLYGRHYYMIAFKMSLFQSGWYLGVAGGYEGDALVHCGHVSSRLGPYDPNIAERDCIEMVEVLRSYWRKRGSRDGTANTAALFQAVILLKENDWDRQAFLDTITNEWHMTIVTSEEYPDDNRAVIISEGCLAAVILVPAPALNLPVLKEQDIPHQAHLIVRVNAMEADQFHAGRVFAWFTAGLCTENAAAVIMGDHTSDPDYWKRCARSAQDRNIFPIFNLIHVGIRENGQEYEGWTEGMRFFAGREMEILHGKDRQTVRNTLYKAAQYVITENIELHEGETLRLSGDICRTVRIQQGKNVRDETVVLTDEE